MMDESSSPQARPLSRSTIVELWRIAVLALGAAAFGFLAAGDAPRRDTYDRVLTALRVVDTTHASLQRDVLQARAGLLRNYDPLVESVVRLHAGAAQLGALLHKSRQDGISGLDGALSKLVGEIGSDDDLVERFKTSNALLQNSLEVSGLLLSQLQSESHPEGSELVEWSGRLGNLMMRFAANPSSDLEQRIRTELDRVQGSETGRTDQVRALLSHANIVLDTLPLVDRAMTAIQASRALLESEIVRQLYLDAYGLTSVSSARRRVVFGSICLGLCGLIALFVYRLREQTRTLSQQLDFESALSEVKNRFSEAHVSLETAVERSLDALRRFFDARACAFVTVDSESRQIEHVYGASAGGELENLAAKARRISVPDRVGSVALAEDQGSAMAVALINSRSYAVLRVTPGRLLWRRSDAFGALLGQASECLASCVRSARDRDEREALLMRLEHSQRLEAIGTLASGIAHEFNNVLLAMMGYGEMALEASRGEPQATRYIREIIHSGQRAQLVIDQILAFSRKGDRINEPFDLSETVKDVLPLVRVSLPDQVTLETDIPARAHAVTGNPIEIQQTLLNLCRNAAQACGDIGTITISISAVELRTRTTLSHGSAPPGSYVVLRVTDTGRGIDARALPHIFDPFFTTRSEAGGTGLGLAAVHGTVVGMAGHIDVHSRPGIGTRFDLYFPLTHRNPIAISTFLNDRPVLTGAGETIVIADRDDEARSMYEEKAAALGYEAIGLSSLDRLRSWLAKPNNTADLIIFDLSLWPGEPNPSQIVQHFSPIPTLLIGDAPNSGLIDRRPPDPMRFLRKPVTTTRLAWAISTMLSPVKSFR